MKVEHCTKRDRRYEWKSKRLHVLWAHFQTRSVEGLPQIL